MARNTLDNEYLNLESKNLYKRPDQLYKSVTAHNITQNDVQNFLKEKDVYTLHYPVIKKFKRNMYRVFSIDELWEIDLCDMKQYQKINDGYSFILTVIDVFSKFAWAKPLKNKSAVEVTKALSNILQNKSRCPKIIQSDHGKEFNNKLFRDLLTKYDIKQYFSYNPIIKCAVVERFNRTLKQLMFKYFTHKKTNRYVDVLQKLVNIYNNSYHSTIKMIPSEVTLNDVKKINRIYSDIYKNKIKKVPNNKRVSKINDIVRIAKPKSNFDRGYEQRWTQEKFYVNKVINKRPFKMYTLVDYKNTPIRGRYYAEQLQKVKILNGYPPIEKIIKTKGLGKSLQYFVKFKDSNPNQWIYKADLEKQHGVNDQK